MSDSKKRFIEGLNVAISEEFGSAIQYVQHAAMVTGAEYDAITKELIVHSNEEMMHAGKLCDAVTDLGGVPTTNVAPIHTANDSKKMLEQDLAGEESAILMYKGLIKQAENLGEYGIRRMLEDLLMDEEEHRRDLLSSLGR